MGYGVPGNIQIRYFMGIKMRYNAIAFFGVENETFMGYLQLFEAFTVGS